jgi:hypothetical protein
MQTEQLMYFFQKMLKIAGLLIICAVCTFSMCSSLLKIGQQCLIGFFCYSRLLPIGLRQIVRQQQRKITNAAPPTLSEALAASQSTFVICCSYFPCD